MGKWRKALGVVVAVLFVFNFIIPPAVFAQAQQQNGDMQQRCAATKAGTETDESIRKECVAYFERAEAASSAGAASGTAASKGAGAGTIALVVLGIAAVGGIVAAAAGGGGGGGGGSAPVHKKTTN
jgi:hypothetical protein